MDQTTLKNISFSSIKKINPNRDWTILLITFGILLVSAIIFDFYFYSKIANGDMYISISREELDLKSLKVDSLKRVVENFDGKKEIVSTMKVQNIIDPSL